MISDGKYYEFECAVSTDNHFLNNPRTLSCGHSACITCFHVEENKIKKCNVCKKLINEDYAANEKICYGFNVSLERNIENLLKVIYKQGVESIHKLKGNLFYLLKHFF